MAWTLSGSATADIRKTIDDITTDKSRIPGLVATIVGQDGKTIFSHASGTKGSDSSEPMTLDTIFWIASCTKLIGGIAAMQLCEQGKLSLDDADMIEKLAPELKEIRILKGVGEDSKAQYVDKAKRITLRMLLTHTGNDMALKPSRTWTNFGIAGFGYRTRRAALL